MKTKLYHIWVQTGTMDYYILVRARNLASAKALALEEIEEIQITGREVFNSDELAERDIPINRIPIREGETYLVSAGT